MGYRTVLGYIENETIEKKSRFIGRLYPVTTEEQVKAIIAAVKKEHHQANHHCTAFRLRGQQLTERYSDDGEPGGTAGMPMLEVLRGLELENVLVVSIRYFGGTKLGTGGLVRAYTASAQTVAAEADIVEIGRFSKLTVEVAYDISGKVEYHINSHNMLLNDIQYRDMVAYSVYVDEAETEQKRDELIELTNGKCCVATADPVDGYVREGRVILGEQ